MDKLCRQSYSSLPFLARFRAQNLWQKMHVGADDTVEKRKSCRASERGKVRFKSKFYADMRDFEYHIKHTWLAWFDCKRQWTTTFKRIFHQFILINLYRPTFLYTTEEIGKVTRKRRTIKHRILFIYWFNNIWKVYCVTW